MSFIFCTLWIPLKLGWPDKIKKDSSLGSQGSPVWKVIFVVWNLKGTRWHTGTEKVLQPTRAMNKNWSDTMTRIAFAVPPLVASVNAITELNRWCVLVWNWRIIHLENMFRSFLKREVLMRWKAHVEWFAFSDQIEKSDWFPERVENRIEVLPFLHHFIWTEKQRKAKRSKKDQRARKPAAYAHLPLHGHSFPFTFSSCMLHALAPAIPGLRATSTSTEKMQNLVRFFEIFLQFWSFPWIPSSPATWESIWNLISDAYLCRVGFQKGTIQDNNKSLQ